MRDTGRVGVCLDTGFLIALSSPSNPAHDVCRQYFEYWLVNLTPMFVSAVSYAEFLCKSEALPDYILRHVHILPFDAAAAIVAGTIERARKNARPDRDTSRQEFRDDIKIIATASNAKVSAIITRDENSMARYVRRWANELPEVSGLRAIVVADEFRKDDAQLLPELELFADSV